ncbi:DUF2812 domain-containing protein [Paenibacillus sp. GCM10023248]|uniref:DUF2812 domain-containing protein n=1 Tax=Bacillales TaxID=1385 RepID=UPI0023782096|nr:MULTISPECIES: DUF2812 domain-containing protein [Bacillales]MDD9268156.1 DUF2812 domain-containing protein [Paenibacillus sp. MAHUQ-63]MDR6879835.1 hypothetical protein [Bacillus sp. 3255]
MRKHQYRNRFSFVWNYEKDESWLTGLSAQGLHLDKPGVIRNRFESNPELRYVYRMDYQKIVGQEQVNEYVALFEDSGWEHVGTIMGWHYFRKPYREGGTYDIYTDRLSVRQLLQRVQTTLGILAIANVPLLIMNLKNLFSGPRSHTISSTLTFTIVLEVLCILLLAYGCVRFQQKIKKLDEQ